MATGSPTVLEFASAEEAASYDAWFRAKVEASMNDGRPCVAHETVMAEIEDICAKAEMGSG